jgi:site-specific DNA-methyltransferase (adenine-specific)
MTETPFKWDDVHAKTVAERLAVLVGDNRELMKCIPDGVIDAIVTDPPYGVNLNPAICSWDVWQPEVWSELFRVTKPGGLMAFTIAPHVAHKRVNDVFDAGWECLEVGSWIWGSGRPVHETRLKRCWDMVYFCGKGTRNLNISDETRMDYVSRKKGDRDIRGVGTQFRFGARDNGVIDEDRYGHPANVACTEGSSHFGNSGYEKIFAVKKMKNMGDRDDSHPTEKPHDLMGQIIRLVSRVGDLVLDPYAGSGSTGKMAIENARRSLLIEQEEKYVNELIGTRTNTTVGLPLGD